MKTWMLLVLLGCSAFGCSTQRGALTLTPANPDPNQGVWVFIDSSSSGRSGIYRCKEDPPGKPVCRKADW